MFPVLHPDLFLGSNYFNLKDTHKFKICTKFIGTGSPNSSTYQYARIFADMGLTNPQSYSDTDVVGISAEGARSGRHAPDYTEIARAVKAGAKFVTDTKYDRNRPYNIGERQVARFLTQNNYQYHEVDRRGIWY